jgi:hypothetical protein
MLFFLSKGYRARPAGARPFDASSPRPRPLDHYADDLKAVTDHLDLRDAIHVGHSTGGGEVVRYQTSSSIDFRNSRGASGTLPRIDWLPIIKNS